MPVPAISMMLIRPLGLHGPSPPSLMQLVTCASWLWKLNTSSLPLRWMCSHDPLGGGPTLPPKVLSLLPERILAFTKPPNVSQQQLWPTQWTTHASVGFWVVAPQEFEAEADTL